MPDALAFRPIVPSQISRADLTAALQPLCDLLNITPNRFYDEPGMQIGHGRVTFVAPSPVTPEDWDADRPPAVRAPLSVGGVFDRGTDQVQVVVVEVMD